MNTKVTPINVRVRFEDTVYVPYRGHVRVKEHLQINRAFAVVVIACSVFWAAVGYRVILLVIRIAR
jgi:hypothetical protein